MKKIIAVILATLMLTGCQLASQETKKDAMNDQLVGVFLTLDHLELEFDMEGWLSDNPGALNGEKVMLDPADAMAYSGQLPAVLSEEGLTVPGCEGLTILRILEEDYSTTQTSEGIVGVSSNIMAGDGGDSVEVEGTVYFPAESEVMLCANPVYMTQTGEYYVVQGNSFQSSLECGSMSHSIQDQRTWTVDGLETTQSAKFTVTVEGVSVAQKVALVWMSKEHQVLSRTEYVPGELPETIEAAGDYLILEEIAMETVTRKIFQPGDETLTVYYQGDKPWCMPDFAEIQWND